MGYFLLNIALQISFIFHNSARYFTCFFMLFMQKTVKLIFFEKELCKYGNSYPIISEIYCKLLIILK